MPPEGANALVESYRTAFRECLSDLRPASLLKLRGELQVVIRWLDVQKQDSLQATGEAAVDALSRFYQFGQEIGGFAASRRPRRTAGYLHLPSGGVLAVEKIPDPARPGPRRVLLGGLAGGLVFVGG